MDVDLEVSWVSKSDERKILHDIHHITMESRK